MKVVLFANHELAIPSFLELIDKELIAGLVMPNVIHEANMRMQATAKEKGIPFMLVDKNAVHNTLPDWLKNLGPDAIFVMTFSYKLPKSILGLPRLGCFNWHTGILPEYRGPDPVFWEFVNGEEAGGVTLHKMNEEFDAGEIIKIEKIPIDDGQTHGEHYKRVAEAAKSLIIYILDMLVVDPEGIEVRPQDESKAKYYKRPEMGDLFIRWESDPAEKIERLVMATNPVYGGARTYFRRRPVHVFQVSLGKPKSISSVEPGTVIAAGSKDGMVVISKDNVPVRLESIYCEEGFYTSQRFVKVFDVKRGEKLQDPRKRD